MIDINLCGMVSPTLYIPEEELGKDFEDGGCLRGFHIEDCKVCDFYPHLEVKKFKLEKLDKIIIE